MERIFSSLSKVLVGFGSGPRSGVLDGIARCLSTKEMRVESSKIVRVLRHNLVESLKTRNFVKKYFVILVSSLTRRRF